MRGLGAVNEMDGIKEGRTYAGTACLLRMERVEMSRRCGFRGCDRLVKVHQLRSWSGSAQLSLRECCGQLIAVNDL